MSERPHNIAGTGSCDSGEAVFTITQLAEEFAVTPRAIRFYEDKDLLHPSRQGQTRLYAPRDRARLKLILQGKRVGFTLAEIREMLDLYDVRDGQETQLRLSLEKFRERIESLRDQKKDIDLQIVQLEEGCAMVEKILEKKKSGGPTEQGTGSARGAAE